MEAIIDKAVADGNKIDAILAENDSTALGVVGALTAKSYGYPAPQRPGRRPRQPEQRRPGQAVRRRLEERQRARQGRRRGRARSCATGTDDGRPDAAGRPLDPTVAPVAGLTAQEFTTPGGTTVKSFILQPTPLTAENLQVAIDAGQITKEDLCKGVDAGDRAGRLQVAVTDR